MKLRHVIPFVLVSATAVGCGGVGGDTTAVPDVTGKRVSAARASAEKAGFELSVEQQGSGSASKARVCSQTPKAGTKLNPEIDSNITVKVRRRCG